MILTLQMTYFIQRQATICIIFTSENYLHNTQENTQQGCDKGVKPQVLAQTNLSRSYRL